MERLYNSPVITHILFSPDVYLDILHNEVL